MQDRDTAGNNYLDSLISKIVGGDGAGFDFDQHVLELLDNSRFFTDEEDAEILRILMLTLAADVSSKQPSRS